MTKGLFVDPLARIQISGWTVKLADQPTTVHTGVITSSLGWGHVWDLGRGQMWGWGRWWISGGRKIYEDVHCPVKGCKKGVLRLFWGLWVISDMSRCICSEYPLVWGLITRDLTILKKKSHQKFSAGSCLFCPVKGCKKGVLRLFWGLWVISDMSRCICSEYPLV